MDISNSFDVPMPVEEAWVVLLDIERIMPCVPGAELLEIIDTSTYKGKVNVKLGPVALSFVGTARFEDLDEAGRKARVLAKGTDAKGRGGVNAVVNFHMEPSPAGTTVHVKTTVNLSGAVAQYGRGTGVIQGVATQLTGQFAESLRAMLAQQKAAADIPGAAPAEAPPAVKPISGLSLLFRALWSAFLGLFTRRAHTD